VVQTFAAPGIAGQPPAALSAGVYFWNVVGTNSGVVGSATSPTWEFWVGHRTATVDSSWGTTLDVNGDGLADVVGGGNSDHTFYLYLSSDGGLGDTPLAFALPSSPHAGGLQVASAGDVNGDGYGDLIVGNGGASAAYVYLGGPGGLSSAPITLSTAAAFELGTSVSSAGDVNGDGYADVLVGDLASPTVYVFLGNASGVSSTPATVLSDPSPMPWVSQFGSSVASAGDVNGDGFGDIVVGARYYHQAFLYLGSPQGITSAIPAVTFSGNYDFGFAVACAGDVDGDGLADIVVSDSTAASVYLGASTGVSSTAAFVLASTPASGADDVDGDGFGDVVADAYEYSGSAAGLPANPTAILTGPGATWVVAAGDVNGDGYGDFLTLSGGVAYLYEGSAGGIGTSPVWSSTGYSFYTAQ
jgi:hypothetical protein